MALTLYNSLTRSLEPFTGPCDGETVRVYTCGPTVYNYQHIGNMRAFLFADTLGRALRWNGFAVKHVINITDVGHLTSDADAGADKMEQAAAAQAKSIWDVAAHYTRAFKADVRRLNIVEPAEWTVATDHIPQMIDFARSIEGSCYRLDSGLYFDTATLPHYGALAGRSVHSEEFVATFNALAEGESVAQMNRAGDRAKTAAAEASRVGEVGKKSPHDFAIWRTSTPGEQRQMEWDSPWGRGAPGWHLECSVMSLQHLGHPFDIHTGGIDHREIHHPNEIAQNQAFCGCDDTGAAWWMHNNFLVDRSAKGIVGKMAKSTGEFLTLQRLVDRGFHPLAYRMMCLQAHYRSELEFSWEGLAAAATRLKRLVQTLEGLRARGEAAEGNIDAYRARLGDAIGEDLNTARALTVLDDMLGDKRMSPAARVDGAVSFDAVLGLELATLSRAELRVRPLDALTDERAVDACLAERREARGAKDFGRSDAIRDELAAKGVEVMDGDPLGWDWKLG